MVSKVNLKARIERHSRILKDNLGNIHPFRSFYHRFNYNVVLFLVVFLFPVYPLFSAFVNDNMGTQLNGQLDESSIIEAYQETDSTQSQDLQEQEALNQEIDNATLPTQDTSSTSTYLNVGVTDDNSKSDVASYNKVIDYEVKVGDSFSSIAYKYGISVNTIYWANSFDSSKVLHPGEKIKILPVSGVLHKVVSGDTLSAISKKYNVDQDKILAQNNLTIDSNLLAGNDLIIPGAVKKVDVPKVNVAKTSTTTKTTSKSTAVAKPTVTTSTQSDDSEYSLVKRQAKWSFVKGNCTRFVAQYKNVDWSGNAKDWLRNAKAKGHATGSTPVAGAIVVFYGAGYNYAYGHVGIVTKVTGDALVIKDMNYRRLYEVTVRKISANDPSIRGYIYVD